MSGHDQGSGAPKGAEDFKFPEEAGLAKPKVSETGGIKYKIGEKTHVWGNSDDYNEDYKDALKAGWIDKNCLLTEMGVEELKRRDQVLKIPGYLVETHTVKPKLQIRSSGGDRIITNRASRESMGEFGKKKLLDSIQIVLEKRGFNILGISAELKETDSDGEEIYTLSIEFGSTGGNGGSDKKQKKTLRLVGNEETLVGTLEDGDFNFPITNNPKKIRRAFNK